MIISRKAVIFSLAGILFIGCGKGREGDAEAHEPEIHVQIALAERGSIDRIISADAVLYPVNQANITPKISAPLRSVFVNRGDRVKAGQVLAELEKRDIIAAADEAKAQFEQAQAALQVMTGATALDERTKSEADLASARQALEAAKKVYESRTELVKQGAFAQKLADDARVAMVQAQGQFDTAQRHLQTLNNIGQREQTRGLQAAADSMKARYDAALAQLSYATITSPVTGVVADRPVYPGETTAPGAPLISVIDTSQIVARANIPAQDAMFIKVGNVASIAGPDGEIAGRVTVVSPAVNPSTTTIEVWVQVANSQEKIKPGVTARVRIQAETLRNVLLVPHAALLNSDEGGYKVMVVTGDNTTHEHKIELGVREGEKQQIVTGLQPGDKVVVSGGLGLEENAKVKPSVASTRASDAGEIEK